MTSHTSVELERVDGVGYERVTDDFEHDPDVLGVGGARVVVVERLLRHARDELLRQELHARADAHLRPCFDRGGFVRVVLARFLRFGGFIRPFPHFW